MSEVGAVPAERGAAARADTPLPPPASDGPLVDVALERLTKHYPQQEVAAVSGIDLEIRRGEFFSLLGPSGSGKTTTLRLIAGFERPTSGRVLLGGSDVTAVPPFKRDVNTVFQSYALFPHMTVERNVAYPLKMKGTPKQDIGRRVSEALELVTMHGYERRLPHQLSGGQRQRVALARALVSRPRVLLLDEPLGALDLQLRQQMQLALKELQREVQISFVYVTHDQGEALAMSDRLAVMHEGQIEQVGTPTDVYYRPRTRFVAGFIGKANLLDCEVERRGDGCVACCGGLTLTLLGDHEPGPGTASIRYEAVGVLPAGASPNGRANRAPAVVDDLVFLGEGQELVLDVGGVRLIARMPAQRESRFRRGDRVEVALESADVAILRA